MHYCPSILRLVNTFWKTDLRLSYSYKTDSFWSFMLFWKIVFRLIIIRKQFLQFLVYTIQTRSVFFFNYFYIFYIFFGLCSYNTLFVQRVRLLKAVEWPTESVIHFFNSRAYILPTYSLLLEWLHFENQCSDSCPHYYRLSVLLFAHSLPMPELPTIATRLLHALCLPGQGQSITL